MRGFSTLEAVIAMAVLVLALSAVALSLFSNQSLLADTEGSAEALGKARALIENAKALARTDFRLVVSTTTTEGAYEKTMAVSSAGFFSKLVAASVHWKLGALHRTVTLPALIADFDNATGGTTCDSQISGDWTHPRITGFDFAALAHDPGKAYALTDVDAYQGRLYVSANTASANTRPTFFIFDARDPASPKLLGSLDNAPSVSPGLNAVAVATSSAGHYAYAANGYDANFRTCKEGSSCAELQVIDIFDPALPKVAANYELPTSSPPYVVGNGGGGNAVGKSIFYKNGYVYLGLSKTTSGPEFNIIDVRDPMHPLWVGSYPAPGTSSGNAVNAIFVQRTHAYLATPNSKELTVLDVADPAHPAYLGTYDAPGGSGNGKSLDVVGDTLYLGRTVGGKELYLLDVADPEKPSLLGQQDTGSASVAGVVVRGALAFLAVGNQFQVWNTGNPAAITPWTPGKSAAEFGTPAWALPSGSTATALECEGNTLYAASVTSANAGFLSVITAP